MWDTRLWLSDEEGNDYLVEPTDPGPEMKVGQRFLYTPGEPPAPDLPYPNFVGDLAGGQDQHLRDVKQAQNQWLRKVEPLKGQWFVDELYWELADGGWIQNVVLTRQKSSRRSK